MSRSPSKLVAAMALLLGVWVAVFWLYKPRAGAAAEGGITFGPPPDLAKALVATAPGSTRASIPEGSSPASSVAGLPVAPMPGQDNSPPAPASVPGPGPRLVAPEFSQYTVQKGDVSFGAISRRVYGTAAHGDAISRANPFVTPDKLVVGKTRLMIPKDPGNIQGKVEGEPAPAAASGVEHTVAAGETLGAISKRYYGTATRWKVILDANSDVLSKPEKLRAGMTLRIPPKD